MEQITLGRVTFKMPYRDMLPALSADEYAALRADILVRGIVVPIVLDEDGNVIDGHHRLQIAAELGLAEFPQEIRPGMQPSEREALALDLNLHRRHLSKDQRDKVIVYRRQKGESTRQIADAVGVDQSTVVRTLERTDAIASVDLPTVITGRDGKTRPAHQPKVRVESVQETARAITLLSEVDNVAGALDVGSLRGVVKEQRKQERQERNRTPDGMYTDRSNVRLICESIEDACEDDSIAPMVDAIITDPPYPREFLPVYQSLAVFAGRMLKPGGSLLVMTGQSYLPDIIELMTDSDWLDYQWTLAYLTPGGQSPQIWPRKVNTFWKPVLWFVKGKYTGEWIGDVIKSDTNDKRFHHWGQSEAGMAGLVERFTQPGDLICDPFCGGGTTGAAALQLRRRFIGIDKDPQAIETTSRRLQDIYAQAS